MDASYSQERRARGAWIALTWISVVACLWLIPLPASYGQTSLDGWSEPVVLFEAEWGIHSPVVVSDRAGGLHLFWRYVEASNPTQTTELNYYTYYDGTTWSTPVDIFAADYLAAPSAATDGSGFVHLIWQGSSEQLQYSRAAITSPISAQSWQPPISLATANVNAHLLSDHTGRLHVVYPGRGSSGVYYRTSHNAGLSWSSPVNIAAASQNQVSANFTRIAMGVDNTLHVVWTEFLLPEAWPPIGLFYARSEDGGQTWSEVTQLAEEGYNQINVAAGQENTVHVLWNGMAGIHGRYHRWSDDNGQTWTATETLNTAGVAGSTGTPPMVVDNAGVLHALVVDGGCLLYLAWQADSWNAPTCISQLAAGATTFIEQPDLTISQGNKLHVVFWDSRERLWYMSRQTDAPRSPPLPLPTAVSTPLPTPTPLPMATVTPNRSYLTTASEIENAVGSMQPVVASILPTLLFIGAAIAVYFGVVKQRS
jgi:hypothetical protein